MWDSLAMTASYRGEAVGLPATGPGSLAGIWPRFGGLFIDGLIVAVASFVVGFVLGSPGEGGADMGRSLVANLLVLAFDAVYTIGLMGSRGRTLGQAAFGLNVIRVIDHQPPGYDVSARRWLVIGSLSFISALTTAFLTDASDAISAVLALIQFVVLAWAIWDPNRQGLHDRFADTLVIQGALALPRGAAPDAEPADGGLA
jgi:uncharacterized RDD family membrane protein YckC